MKTILSRLLVALIVVVLCFSSLTVLDVKAQPRTIVVPDDYPTIQEAIDAANIGDTVYVKKGTYLDQSLVIDKPLSLIGEDPENTILQGPDIEYEVTNKETKNELDFSLLTTKNSYINFLPSITIIIQLIEANDVTISGFTLTNAYTCISGTGNTTWITENNFESYNNAMSIGGKPQNYN